jgi:hypothetical protein
MEKKTDTTYERHDVTMGTVEVITLLDVRHTTSGVWSPQCLATVAVETVRGETVTETIDVIALSMIEPSVLSAYFGG